MNKVFSVDPELGQIFEKAFQNAGFEMSRPAFTCFMARKDGATITFYISGKVMFQGKEPLELIPSELMHHFPQEGAPSPILHLREELPLIGTDESGKGDFFGPLVVAGIGATEEHLKVLQALGVRDSKLLTDTAILEIAQHLKELLPHAVYILQPSRYNALYAQIGNLNHLLAAAHGKVIEQLRKTTGISRVLVDQFTTHDLIRPHLKASPDLVLMQRVRAESHPVVAAASILARAAFTQEIDKISERLEMIIPKGASKQVLQAGRQIVIKYGEPMLEEVAKVHFKTFTDIIG